MHTKITKRVLDGTVPPTNGILFLRDTELTGFGARISNTGSVTFFAEGRLRRSRNKRVSLGRYPIVSIEDAREKAKEALYKLTCGIDPLREERQRVEAQRKVHALEQAYSITLSDVIDDYFKSRPIKSEADYRAVLKNGFSDWLNSPIRDITRQNVEIRYRKIAFRDRRKAQATKAMRYLSAIMNFAKAELVAGQPLLADNPINVLRDKKIDRTVRPRDNYIPKEKIGVVIRAILSECTVTARDLLLFELFTGLRDGEAKSVKWSDVDFDRRIITIPETKNGKPHCFGMGQFVIAMMRYRFRDRSHETWVFANRSASGPLGSVRKQLLKVHRKSNFSFTHHDLRRTFATLLSGELGIPDSTISKLLNHSPSGVTAKHYVKAGATMFTGVYDQLHELVNSCLLSGDCTEHIADLIQTLYPSESISEATRHERRDGEFEFKGQQKRSESIRQFETA